MAISITEKLKRARARAAAFRKELTHARTNHQDYLIWAKENTQRMRDELIRLREKPGQEHEEIARLKTPLKAAHCSGEKRAAEVGILKDRLGLKVSLLRGRTEELNSLMAQREDLTRACDKLTLHNEDLRESVLGWRTLAEERKGEDK